MGLSDLPCASGAAHVKAFVAAGFVLQPRRGRGTHFLLKKPGVRWTLSIPDHKEVKRQLLSKQIANAGLTHDEYVELFRTS